MKIKISFFKRIFIFSIFIIIITVFLGYIFNVFFLDKFYIHRKARKMLIISEKIKTFSPDDSYLLNEYTEKIKYEEGINIFFINPNHRSHNMENMHKEDSLKVTDLRNPRFYNFHINETKRTGIRMLVYEEPLSSGEKLVMNTSLSAFASYKQEISIFNIITTLTALLISTLICRVFAKKITKDLEKLNITAKKISILDFSEKTEIDRSDEIGELSESINIMSENLERAIENLKSFASNASHELKTPITVINTHAQALVAGIVKDESEKTKYYKTIFKESMEMSDLVNNLLTISRLSSPGKKIDIKEVNIMNLIENSIEKYETLELEKDLHWDITKNDFIIFGNENLLKIAVDNIVQNTLKYSKYRSTIKIAVTETEVIFKNLINGTLSKNKELLWEPFSRGDNAVDLSIDGNGLGLSIVKMILALNNLNSEIIIENNNFIFIIKKKN